MAKVVLRNISKSFGDKEILKNINLEIEDGEFIVLVGASGCGKSTLLRMVAGLETQTGGDIFIGSELVNEVHPKDRNIAMVFQNYALYPHLNVYDNISLGLKVRNMAKCEIERRVKRAAEILKLEDLKYITNGLSYEITTAINRIYENYTLSNCGYNIEQFEELQQELK